MLETIKKTAWIFKIWCFLPPHTAMKQENDYNSPNMQPFISYFQCQVKFIKRHILGIFSKTLSVLCPCYRHAYFFPFFNFKAIFCDTCMLVRDLVKQSERL